MKAGGGRRAASDEGMSQLGVLSTSGHTFDLRDCACRLAERTLAACRLPSPIQWMVRGD